MLFSQFQFQNLTLTIPNKPADERNFSWKKIKINAHVHLSNTPEKILFGKTRLNPLHLLNYLHEVFFSKRDFSGTKTVVGIRI